MSEMIMKAIEYQLMDKETNLFSSMDHVLQEWNEANVLKHFNLSLEENQYVAILHVLFHSGYSNLIHSHWSAQVTDVQSCAAVYAWISRELKTLVREKCDEMMETFFNATQLNSHHVGEVLHQVQALSQLTTSILAQVKVQKSYRLVEEVRVLSIEINTLLTKLRIIQWFAAYGYVYDIYELAKLHANRLLHLMDLKLQHNLRWDIGQSAHHVTLLINQVIQSQTTAAGVGFPPTSVQQFHRMFDFCTSTTQFKSMLFIWTYLAMDTIALDAPDYTYSVVNTFAVYVGLKPEVRDVAKALWIIDAHTTESISIAVQLLQSAHSAYQYAVIQYLQWRNFPEQAFSLLNHLQSTDYDFSRASLECQRTMVSIYLELGYEEEAEALIETLPNSEQLLDMVNHNQTQFYSSKNVMAAYVLLEIRSSKPPTKRPRVTATDSDLIRAKELANEINLSSRVSEKDCKTIITFLSRLLALLTPFGPTHEWVSPECRTFQSIPYIFNEGDVILKDRSLRCAKCYQVVSHVDRQDLQKHVDAGCSYLRQKIYLRTPDVVKKRKAMTQVRRRLNDKLDQLSISTVVKYDLICSVKRYMYG